MLLPALSAAKEKGRAASCMNNIKQILLADSLYADDNGDALVPYWEYYQNYPSLDWKFVALLNGYLKPGTTFNQSHNEWMRCPSQQAKDAWGDVIAGIDPVVSIGNHNHFVHSDGINAPFRVSAKRSEIKFPALNPSWMDVDGGSSQGWPAVCRGCWTIDTLVYPAVSSEFNNFGRRHNGGSNVGFVDGHCEWVSLVRLHAPCVQGGTDFFRHWDNWP